MGDEMDFTDMMDAADERAAIRRERCQCGGDMPGRCPGLAFCPMCQPEETE
jgi:hypothetical protein